MWNKAFVDSNSGTLCTRWVQQYSRRMVFWTFYCSWAEIVLVTVLSFLWRDRIEPQSNLGWKRPLRMISPTPLHKAGLTSTLDDVAQGLVLSSVRYLQRWRVHNLSMHLYQWLTTPFLQSFIERSYPDLFFSFLECKISYLSFLCLFPCMSFTCSAVI